MHHRRYVTLLRAACQGRAPATGRIAQMTDLRCYVAYCRQAENFGEHDQSEVRRISLPRTWSYKHLTVLEGERLLEGSRAYCTCKWSHGGTCRRRSSSLCMRRGCSAGPKPPNFLELRQREVRRMHLPGTSVNKPEVWFLTNLAHSPGYLLASIENFEDHPA